jgi:predicted Zn-dependent protease
MSNLICAAGDRHEDALLEELWNGLYVHRLADGWAQSGRVGARIVLAEDVRRGRRTGRYRTGAQVDERDDVLFRAQALGSSPTFNPNAMCGKAAQVLSDVGTAAPAIRLSELVLAA